MPWRPCDTATVEDGPASAMFGGFGVQGVGLGLVFFLGCGMIWLPSVCRGSLVEKDLVLVPFAP